MNGKDCSLCVYKDGLRADGTFRCCTPERFNDRTITDCCVEELPLRKLQSNTRDVDAFIGVTNEYVNSVKSKSLYWRKVNKSDGQQ